MAGVLDPSTVTVGTERVSRSILGLTCTSGTERTTPSTSCSASRDSALSIAAVSRDAVAAVLTAYPASRAAASMPKRRFARE